MQFKQLARKTQTIISTAGKLSQQFGHQQVDLEHILLALLKQKDDDFIRFLEKLNIDIRDLQRFIENELHSSTRGYQIELNFVDTLDRNKEELSLYTPRAITMLQMASYEASYLGDKHVTTKHIFLAILTDNNTPIANILQKSGITRDRIIPDKKVPDSKLGRTRNRPQKKLPQTALDKRLSSTKPPSRKRKRSRPQASKKLWEQYFGRMAAYFEEWSQRYTDLQLTTDIRVASYKGQRLKRDKNNNQWWFREALVSHVYEEDSSTKRIILGDPGGGKTTACQHTSWEMAKIGIERISRPMEIAVIPVYYELNSYRANDPYLEDLLPHQRILALLSREIAHFISQADMQIEFEFGWRELEKYLVEERFSFFLDGLNEVGLYHRDRLINDIMAFIDVYDKYGHQFVITMRKMDYEYDLAPFFSFDEFMIVEILELDSSGVNEFILRDLGQLSKANELANAISSETTELRQAKNALNALLTGEGQPEKCLSDLEKAFFTLSDERKAEGNEVLSNIRKANKLINVLRQPNYARVLWLSQNPSTLKDVIDVYRYEEILPRSRVRLFERAILARMSTQSAKNDNRHNQFTEELKLSVMQSIAFQMTDPNEGLSLMREKVLSVIIDTFDIHNIHDKSQATDILNELVFSDAFLIERVPGEYSFIKQPYQEYFVARELRDKWNSIMSKRKNPLKDSQLHPFFYNRQYFQFSAAMTGLLESKDAAFLIERFRKRKQTQRLAALCIRTSEDIPSHIVKDFAMWTEKKIWRFALIPDQLLSLVFVIATIILLIFSFYLNTDYGGISQAISSIANSTINFIYPSWSSSFLELLSVSIIIILLGLLIRLITHRFFSIDEDKDLSFLLDTFLIVVFGTLLLFFLGGFGRSSFWVGINFVSLMLFVVFVLTRINTLMGPSTVRLTHRIEDYVVSYRLMHYLEIFRDMGPTVGSRLTEIQSELDANRNISSRIKDAIQRAWVISPRTVLQVLDELHVLERQAETAKVLGSAVLSPNVESNTREQAAAGLFTLLDISEGDGALIETIRALSNLAIEQPSSFRGKSVSSLKKILSANSCSLRVRRQAYNALKELGEQNLIYPKPSMIRTPSFWIAIFVLSIIFFVLFFVR